MSDSAADPFIGRLVAGRYRVIKQLGEGGMGQVYLAEHEAIEKKVALKILRPEYTRKEDIVTRFQQEAISASRIKHPNVLDVFDFGKLDSGEAFLAMEFLEGHDMSDELAKVKVLEPVRGLQIAIQICRALAAAHSRGVVHRDMKPENVFLQRTGDGEEIVKIVDFGIAQLRTTEEAAKAQPSRRRLTKTGMIFGTPEYMAPEQAAGRQADLRVDIYAVGVILYEMFTSAVPFTGDSFMAVLTATLNQPPPPMIEMNPELRIGPELQAVIMRALAKDPAVRQGSMAELMGALLGTPEGTLVGRHNIVDARYSSFPAPAENNPTAAQFGAKVGSVVPPAAPTALSPGNTAQLGTPGAAAATKKPTSSEGGQSSTVAPARTANTGLIVGSLAFVVLVLGVGGYVVSSRLGGDVPAGAEPALAATAAAKPTAPPPVATLTPLGLATGTPQTTIAPVGPTQSEVKLKIETEPPGASLEKGGFQICPATPCEISVARNEGIELTAKKGALRGQVKVLPQNDQTVSMKLTAIMAKPKPAASATPRMCETFIGELKVLRPCQ